MKVASWDSYDYGSYGDHLMTIQFAKELEKLGDQGKNHASLESVNANFAILPASAKNIKLATLLVRAGNIRNAKARFDFATIKQNKKLSWGHIDRLKEPVNHHSRA